MAFVAVTVTTEELPLVMDVGLATTVTVGADVLTVMVIVTDAVAVPPAPVAVAVYVVAEVGLTDTDPPVAPIVRLLPLLPVIVIPVAPVAVTVKTEELPLVIDVGLAVIVTVGAVAANAWLLRPTLTNAIAAHGSSIARTKRTNFMTIPRQLSLPRKRTRK